jgi:NADPH:quinone reductase-like Zn-dependent oxidoreductase
MQAVYFEAFGDADVLQLGELPRPVPAPHQVLVQVAAAGVNPADRRIRAGEHQGIFKSSFPVISGWDVSGKIVELGSDVSGWQVGDEVVGLGFTLTPHFGSYSEFMPIDSTAVARKPSTLSFVEGASVPLVALTAWQSLTEIAKVKTGQSVFISAGAGGLGSMAIILAKHLGCKVYTTTRGANFDYVRGLGAYHPIDYTTARYVDEVKLLEPDGVDVVLELVDDGYDAVRVCRSGGTVVLMNDNPPDMPEISERGIHAQWIHHRADGAMLQSLIDLFGNNTLKLPPIETLPLSAAVKAHRKIESGRTKGKIVLSVADI